MIDRSRVATRVAIAGIMLAATPGVGGCDQPAMTIDVATHAHDFQPQRLLVAAEQATTVVYHNQEVATEHNIAIYTRQGGDLVARSDSIIGPDGITELALPPLAIGTYFVQCDIHPFMTGALIVRDPDSS